MSASVDAKMDINEFYKDVRGDIGKLLNSVNEAAIYNDSGKEVTFYVYNYSDGVHWIPACDVKVAPGYFGSVAASGTVFKIDPDNNKDNEFLVAPEKGYVFKGPGKVEKVN
ncbi:hypothetical protein OAG68_01435 [bacterium]|nr:hypothetical protein [bacterium]